MEKIMQKIAIITSLLCALIVGGSGILYVVKNTGGNESDTQTETMSYAWYHNIGDSNAIAKQANYSTCNLQDVVKQGDLVYERSGGFGVSGHIAIIEGVMESSNGYGEYIQTIEAISDGVVRSVLDCDRLIERNGTVVRVTTATDLNIQGTLEFAKLQLGKKYDMKYPFSFGSVACDKYSEKYTCSQLAYCAYKLQGIKLKDSIISIGPVMPNAIYASKKTKDVTIGFSEF